jgi:GT2 family glycosyltransferase
MENILISIIIVNWNTRELLKQCIESIKADIEHIGSEIIVVDNASSDGSVEMIENRFPDVKIIKNSQNMGFAKANNSGIRAATGKYVCLINSDVRILENGLRGTIDFFEKNPQLGIISPMLLNSDMTQQSSCKIFPSLWTELSIAFGFHKLFGKYFSLFNDDLRIQGVNPIEVDVLAGTFWLTLKSSIERVGLLDEDFFFYREDYDWCKRFWEQGFPVLIIPKYKVVHHGGASSSAESVRFKSELYRSKLIYWKKYFSKKSSISLIAIIILGDIFRGLFSLIGMLCSNNRDGQISKFKYYKSSLLWMLSNSFKIIN